MSKGTKWIIGIIIVLLIAAATMSNEEDLEEKEVAQEVEEPVVAPKKEKEVAPEEKEEEPESEEVEPIDNSALEQVALQTLKDSFKESGTVVFDEEYLTYIVTPTDPLFVADLVAIMDGSLPKDDWDYLVESVVGVSISLNGMLGDGYTVGIGNPLAEGKMILIVSDGVIIYDMFRDEEF